MYFNLNDRYISIPIIKGAENSQTSALVMLKETGVSPCYFAVSHALQFDLNYKDCFKANCALRHVGKQIAVQNEDKSRIVLRTYLSLWSGWAPDCYRRTAARPGPNVSSYWRARTDGAQAASTTSLKLIVTELLSMSRAPPLPLICALPSH